MKAMSCKQLGGACDVLFQAETFEEIAQKSQTHGREMFARNEPAHMEAMGKMMELMKSPEHMQEWMTAKKAEFEAQPEI